MSVQDNETNLAHQLVRQKGKTVAKNGKESGNIIATNLCPLKDMSRYVPPLMHLIMGLTNDLVKALVNHIKNVMSLSVEMELLMPITKAQEKIIENLCKLLL